MDTVTTLTSEFHKIQSTNIQQSHKNFKLFLSTLHENLKTNENENNFIANLTPQTKLENLFKIDLLLHLKRHEEILGILKGGNSHYIGRILKDYKLFGDIIPKLNVKMVIDDIFPRTSYIAKLKVLNRISKTVENEELLDEYFDEIEKRYGLRMAFVLLPGCSKKLIRFKVEKYTPKLPSRHVIEIFKKDHSFPLFYFDLMKKINEDFNVLDDYSILIKFIVKKDPSLFWKLQQKFEFDFKIGKHLTKKLIFVNEEVLKDGEKCVKWFQNKELYKTVKEKERFDEFLLTFYRDTPTEFLEEQILKYSSTISNILKFISPEKQYDLIQSLFTKKYSQNILRYKTKFPSHFLEIIPVSIREAIIKEHYDTKDDYLYLLNPNDAFYEIKKLLESSSKIEDRIQKLELLSKTIEMNLNNEEIITKILKFVFERYRNDVRPFKAFVYRISDKDKNLKSFNESQLILLNQMAPYTLTDYSNRLAAEKISTAYLEYLIKTNKPYDNYLMDYLKRIALDDYYYNYIFEREFEKMNVIFEKLLDMIENFKDNEISYKKLTKGVIKHIHSYNTKHKKNLFPLCAYKNVLKYVFENGNAYDNGEYFKYLIKKHNDKDIHQYFWKHYKHKNEWNILIWFFKNDIKQIEDNLDLILSSNPYLPSKMIYKAFETYSTDFIKEKSLEFIKKNIGYDNWQCTSFLMPILCYITDSKNFLAITAPFMPPLDGKYETENTINKKIVHELTIKCLCNIKLEEPLKVVKKVCIGDYLKFGIKVLYKIVLNMNEIDVLNFLNDFKQPSISVSKHTLFLSLLLQVQEADNFLKKSLETEKNSSIKNIMFKKWLDIFLNTKNEITYKQLKGYFKIINPEDTNLLKIIIKNIKNVPNDYKIDYIQNVVDVIKKTKKKDVPDLLIILSKTLPKTILNDVPLNLLEIITEIILEQIFLRGLNEDCFWDFIVNTNQERSKDLFSFTIEIMKEMISTLTNSKTGYLQIRNSLDYFGTTFCKKILKTKDMNHINLIKIIDLQWDFFPKHCLLNTIFFIKITKIFYESEFNLEKFTFLLNKLLHQLINEYDSNIILEFSIQINELFKIIDEEKDDLLSFTKFLIQSNSHNYNYILAIYLLPNMFPMEDNVYNKWVEVIRLIEEFCIKGNNTGCVCFHYDKYLREHRHEFIWVGNQKFSDGTTTKL